MLSLRSFRFAAAALLFASSASTVAAADPAAAKAERRGGESVLSYTARSQGSADNLTAQQQVDFLIAKDPKLSAVLTKHRDAIIAADERRLHVGYVTSVLTNNPGKFEAIDTCPPELVSLFGPDSSDFRSLKSVDLGKVARRGGKPRRASRHDDACRHGPRCAPRRWHHRWAPADFSGPRSGKRPDRRPGKRARRGVQSGCGECKTRARLIAGRTRTKNRRRGHAP